ncbi:MAG: hypothetical protein EOO07_07945 [Chitinophagaceae bacterium]|nr:MAG: hypothetical protein EOO07_07945 [Chitinophagaceae bacterium]
MRQQISNQVLFYGSCLLAAYFGFLLLDAFVLHIDFVLIGVFRELLTIPAVLLLLFMLVMTFVRWIKWKFKLSGYPFWSFTLTVITTATIVLVTIFEEPRTSVERVESTATYKDES